MRKTVKFPSAASNKKIDLTEFATDDELRIWLDTLLILISACNGHGQSEQVAMCREASTAIIHVLDQTTSYFTDKLSFIHKYIAKNKHSILIEQLLIELNTDASLLS